MKKIQYKNKSEKHLANLKYITLIAKVLAIGLLHDDAILLQLLESLSLLFSCAN